MESQKESPAGRHGQSQERHKDSKFSFRHPIRQRIYELFLSGGQYSVIDLSDLLHIPDPRSHIRYIRNAGIPISDYWMKSEFSKHKIYFLR